MNLITARTAGTAITSRSRTDRNEELRIAFCPFSSTAPMAMLWPSPNKGHLGGPMRSRFNERPLLRLGVWLAVLVAAAFVNRPVSVYAQVFNSGSDGSDGAYAPSGPSG